MEHAHSFDVNLNRTKEWIDKRRATDDGKQRHAAAPRTY